MYYDGELESLSTAFEGEGCTDLSFAFGVDGTAQYKKSVTARVAGSAENC